MTYTLYTINTHSHTYIQFDDDDALTEVTSACMEYVGYIMRLLLHKI